MNKKVKTIIIISLVLIAIVITILLCIPKKEEKTYLEVDPKFINMQVGDIYRLIVNSNQELYYSSLNENIATVNNGIVTAKNVGTTKIQILTKDGKRKEYISLSISELAQNQIKVNSISVELNDQKNPKYAIKGSELIIEINFSDKLEKEAQVLFNNEELNYTFIKNTKNIFVSKAIDSEKAHLKVLYEDRIIYDDDIVIIDNQKPSCELEYNENIITISGDDNYEVVSYSISNTNQYNYSSTKTLKYSTYGKYYGAVKDGAGNTGYCTVEIKNPEIVINPADIIIVGDSRMEELCNFKWYKQENGTCVNKIGQGYSWFVSEAIPQVNSALKKNKKYITTNLGVNDLYHIKSYITKYQELATSTWKNYDLFLISVNPTKGEYNYQNSTINDFNKELKKLADAYPNIIYCDTNSQIKKKGFESGDGLHYKEGTSKEIYQLIKACIYDYYN